VKNVEVKQPYRDLAFFADSMHGSLARKLRIFGLNTTYMRSICDELVMSYCIKERRILLTSDKGLFKRSLKKRIDVVLLQGHSDKENMVKIFSQYKIKNVLFDSEFARCPVCNRELEKKKSDNLSGKIPPKTLQLCFWFYQCKGCEKIYWEGSHTPALVALADSVNQELNKLCF
jgi:uncharacterized protein